MVYVEPSPDRCPNGHPLSGPGRDVTVGWLPCLCNPQPGWRNGHRTIHCWHCHMIWHHPPHHGQEWTSEATRWSHLATEG
jgi:hypothetical protein